MLSHEENERLTRVEGDAPMGRYLANFWIPVALSTDLISMGAPRRVSPLGKRLVAFRNASGAVGVLDENCPHRGASLALARNDAQDSLQCLYHGWRVDVCGNIVDTPSEPGDSTFKSRIKHVAYPVHESAGLVWAYVGDPAAAPPFPRFPWEDVPAESLSVVRAVLDCNWVQSLEGAVDSAHTLFLHSDHVVVAADNGGRSSYAASGDLGRPTTDLAPKLVAENTWYGFRYAALRVPAAQADTHRYARVTSCVLPYFAFFPAPQGMEQVQIFAPLSDVSTLFLHLRWKTDGAVMTKEERARHEERGGLRIGLDVDPDGVKLRNRGNNWLQDRDAMTRGSFSGIFGIHNQDVAVQESMGPIVDRTREHLGTSDVAVIRLRRLLLDGAKSTAEAARPNDFRAVRAYEGLIPIDQDWRVVAPVPPEPAAGPPVPS